MRQAIRCIDPAGASLGEGPVWVADQAALFWVDIHGCRIHRFDPLSETRQSWPTPFRIGALAPRQDGGFVGASELGFILTDADFRHFNQLGTPEGEPPRNRFNDGKLDLHGRFWAGTMDDAEKEATGALYRLDPDLRWSRMDANYRVTNGPAFSPDGRWLYHSDSAAQSIYRFALAADGSLSGKAVFRQFGAGEGFPDGMTCDRDGCLWVAFWDGGCLRRFAPDGAVLETLPLPVARPTSCAFGGENLAMLFITSARVGLTDDQRAAQPLAGGLFAFGSDVPGFATPAFPF